jgi:hypothetical protein
MGSKSAISRETLAPVTDEKQNTEEWLSFLGTQYCFQEDKYTTEKIISGNSEYTISF